MDSPRKMSGASWVGLVWLVLNAAGWGLGFGIEFWILQATGSGGLSTLFGSLVAAGVIGLAQWLMLRWLMPRLAAGSQGIAWVILTMFGFAAGLVMGTVVLSVVGADSSAGLAPVATFLFWVLIGALVGAFQWTALRFLARGMAWWVLANGLGYGIGAVLISLIQVGEGGNPFYYALTGLVVGITTLVALVQLRRPVR